MLADHWNAITYRDTQDQHPNRGTEGALGAGVLPDSSTTGSSPVNPRGWPFRGCVRPADRKLFRFSVPAGQAVMVTPGRFPFLLMELFAVRPIELVTAPVALAAVYAASL